MNTQYEKNNKDLKYYYKKIPKVKETHILRATEG